MEVLPLKHVWLEDKKDLGFEIVYLAHLMHLGLDVPEGVAAYPPKRLLNELLNQYSDSELFISSRERLKKDWLRQAVPENFIQSCQKIVEISVLKINKIWVEMLEGWFEQLSRAIVMKRNHQIPWTGEYALFCGNSQKSGWMEVTGASTTRVLATQGELDSEDHTRLDMIAKKINGIIPVAVKVWWLRDDSLKIVRVSEIFFDQVNGVEVKSVGEKIVKEDERMILVTKILLTGGKTNQGMADGWYQQITEVDSVDVESAKLTALGLENEAKKYIYRVGDLGEGTLEWLQNMDRVRHDLHRVIELEKLTNQNIEVCFPYCRSVIEYQTLRAVVVKMNYSLRKMFWLEMATPENMLNIEQYLEQGIRGVVINVDKLAHLLQGLDNEVSKAVVPNQTEVLDSVIGIGIKKLHRANCRVLIAGERVYDAELLDLAVRWGVWGVVTNQVNYEVVAQMLEQSERRIFQNLGATV